MRKLKFFYKFLIGIGVILGINILGTGNITYATQIVPPSISAESAVVIDADTGQVVYSKNGDTQLFPASTTKVMTALLVLENANLHDKVTIGKNPPFAKGSSIGLKEGEVFTVEDLLTGLMLESGNDCALALAEYISGSEENFAILMNEKSKSIGCNNTNFKNPSGLPDDGHLTTAYDLSLILKEAIKYEDFIRISTLMTKKLPPSNLDGYERYANNHNSLLNKESSLYYQYASAGKTGYTDVARHTYTTSAKKDGRTLVASFIKAEDKNQNYKEVAELLDFAFNTTENVKLYSKGETIENITLTKNSSIPLILENDFIYTKLDKTKTDVNAKVNFDLPSDVKTKTLKKNELITTGTVVVDGIEIGKVNILSGIDRTYTPFIAIKEFSNNEPFLAFGIAALIFIVTVLIFKIFISKKNKIQRKMKWKKLTKNLKKKS